jgi:hypothetical protein
VPDEDEIRRAEEAHERALTEIRKATPGRPGFGNESVYGQTYQYLVRLGVRPQIKLKYRVRLWPTGM